MASPSSQSHRPSPAAGGNPLLPRLGNIAAGLNFGEANIIEPGKITLVPHQMNAAPAGNILLPPAPVGEEPLAAEALELLAGRRRESSIPQTPPQAIGRKTTYL